MAGAVAVQEPGTAAVLDSGLVQGVGLRGAADVWWLDVALPVVVDCVVPVAGADAVALAKDDVFVVDRLAGGEIVVELDVPVVAVDA